MRLNERLNGRTGSSRSNGRRDRGQAEVVGLVLIIGMTVAGLTVVVGFGAQALEDSQSESQIQRAEHAMTQFDSRASLVGLGTTDSQTLRTNFQGTNSDFYVDENAGWMNVTIYNASNPSEVEAHVMNVTLGAVVYEQGDTTVVYQGGGVWKKTGDGSVMVSPPEYHFQATTDDPTLTLPVVLVRGDRNLDSAVAIKRDGAVVSKYPVDGNDDLSNPFDGGIVKVTVQSDYYESWGQFMEERADGEVEYDHDRQAVTSELISSAGQFKIESGIFLANRDGKVNHFHSKEGKSGVHQYNSTVGPVETSYDGYGELRAEGGVEIQDGRFNASTVTSASGEVRLEGGGWTPGNLSYGGWLNNESSMDFHIRGWVRKDAQVTDAQSLGTLVQDRRAAIKVDHDNAGSDIVMDDDEWTFDESKNSWTLTAGDYYVNKSDKIEWKEGDETLTLDLKDGDIELVMDVKEWKLEEGSKIEVINPDGGTARIYLASSEDPKFEVKKGSKVTVTDDRAPSLWMYGNKDEKTHFKVEDGASFTGVYYAPGRDGETKADIKKNAVVYGAVVAQEIKLEENGTVYFDQALKGESPLASGEYTSKITFLHISVNKVRVES
ncbi:MAG: hypothetical protein R3324_00045 [Halobacteriales archaeon]|nr:hypothetical protein [Halobacteriales archaeon]